MRWFGKNLEIKERTQNTIIQRLQLFIRVDTLQIWKKLEYS